MKLLDALKGLSLVAIALVVACAPPVAPGNSNEAETPLPVSPPPALRPTATQAGFTAVPLSSPTATEQVTMTTTPQIESGMQALIEAAAADLMQRLSVTRDSIEVVSAQSVVWPDGSLGCPQPGMLYPQVLTEGYRIELRVKDQVYAYHGGEGRGPFLCENPAK